jgi:opacity protein-like surface antigen
VTTAGIGLRSGGNNRRLKQRIWIDSCTLPVRRCATRTPLIALVSSLAIAAAAAARAERRVIIFAGGGIAVPGSPDAFREKWKEGFDVTLGVGFPLASKLSLQGAVAYDQFSFDKSLLSGEWTGGESELLSFSGEVRFRFVEDSGRLSPYLVGGAGVVHVWTMDLTQSFSPTSPDDLVGGPAYFDPQFYGVPIDGFTETAAMTTFGGGVDIPLTESTQFFVEARYQISFTSDEIEAVLAFRESTEHWTVRGGLRFAL